MHDLVIRNAKVLSSEGWTLRNIAVDEGAFSAFDPYESAKETFDAGENLLFPGGVDLHVHFNEPGRTHWEGFETGTLSAAAGGNTFVVEMPLNSVPSTVSAESLQTKLSAIKGKSHLDYGLWGGLVPGNVPELVALSDAGVAGFKAFMSPSGTDDFINSDTATLKSGMSEIAKTGKILAVHAEDPNVLEATSGKLASKETARDWETSRPIIAELTAVSIALELAGETGCRIHIVHVSAPEVLELIDQGKQAGVNVTCETCPHYLLLSIEDASRIGPSAKCAPPLRSRQTIQGLWNALRNNKINTIGSDHSPCPQDLKEGKSFYEAWGGISGIQSGLPLLWEYCGSDRETLKRIIDLSASHPAELMGLPSKGKIEVGFDADFVVVKREAPPQTVKANDLHYRHRHSAYCGMQTSYAIEETWQKGRPVYRNGLAAGNPSGSFVRM